MNNRTEIYSQVNAQNIFSNSSTKYFNFDTNDDIKKIEKKCELNLKMYEEQMVLDLFKNGIDEKYFNYTSHVLDKELKQKETGKILNLFGLYCVSINDITLAIEYFKRALDLGWITSSTNIALCYKELKNFTQAELYFKKSINYNNHDAHASLGLLYEHNKEYEKAIKTYKEGIENVGCIKSSLFLAQYYEDCENYEQVQFYYLKGINLIYANINDISNIDTDVKEIFGNYGYFLWSELDEYEQGIKYLKEGMKLNDPVSYYFYGQILSETMGEFGFEKINNWEEKVIETYEKAIELNMDLDSIYELVKLYNKNNQIDKMLNVLNLGAEINDYYCLGTLSHYYYGLFLNTLSDYANINNINIEKAIELYKIINKKFKCDYSLVKLANIYGMIKFNQIDEFVRYNKIASNNHNWLGSFELGIYYLKSNHFNKATKFLTKALDLYWKKKESDVIFPGQFEHEYDTNEYELNYYINKYINIFNIKNVQQKIKSSINDSMNIVEYIDEIIKIFNSLTNGYYPILIILLLNCLNEQKTVFDILVKINDGLDNNFMLSMVKIFEKKTNQKKILNRIKRAKINKNYKECIICYENKVHIKFDCGHEVCFCCFKKMFKCHYNCK